jgi:hypothetical protein
VEKSNHLKLNLSMTIKIHPDLEGLIFFKQDIKNEESSIPFKKMIYNGRPVEIFISNLNMDEPSLIDPDLKICEPNSPITEVQKLSYYPRYSELTAEQRWVYLKFLETPYNKSFEIGYVFILFFGLERHLFKGQFEKAFQIILKLREIHSNKSFQHYSASALILSALLNKKTENMNYLINSLDNDFEYNFSDNLFLLCCHICDRPLNSKDIMRMCKSFDFKNLNYIKKYPSEFHDELKRVINLNYGSNEIHIRNFIPNGDLSTIGTIKERIFANSSISKEVIEVPLILGCESFKTEMFDLLKSTHENIRSIRAELRKKNSDFQVQNFPKQKKEVSFDTALESSLLKDLEKNSKDLVKRHFTYIDLQDLYYKYRNLDRKYLEKCKEYCLLDINSLKDMIEQFIQQEIDELKETDVSMDLPELNEGMKRIKNEGFIGNIPAFSKLSIILEKEGKIHEAIKICQRGIEMNHTQEYLQKRLVSLKRKLTRQNKES